MILGPNVYIIRKMLDGMFHLFYIDFKKSCHRPFAKAADPRQLQATFQYHFPDAREISPEEYQHKLDIVSNYRRQDVKYFLDEQRTRILYR